MKDIGTLDYPPNYITDVVEYKSFQFILVRENYKSGSSHSWDEREKLDILRIRHSPDNVAVNRCPLCGLDKDFRCRDENSTEIHELLDKMLRLVRTTLHPKNLTK